MCMKTHMDKIHYKKKKERKKTHMDLFKRMLNINEVENIDLHKVSLHNLV